ncbi:hypothetical protein B1812_06255 [Methylocystis bryophila]|uniref:Uncharacterized protein n=1 Tax=Methylocystis bryophila TaxID=655015 RepID=A0A1W6MT08_9HYPH|nr:hypothetical protein B1812_06255 [Methylocystis bryophila]
MTQLRQIDIPERFPTAKVCQLLRGSLGLAAGARAGADYGPISHPIVENKVTELPPRGGMVKARLTPLRSLACLHGSFER